MKTILKIFSYLVIALFVLSLFGWMVFHISKGDKRFGFLTEPVKFMYTFPDMFKQSVEEVKTLPKTFIKTPQGFESINKLEEDLVVISTYSDTGDTRSIVLQNLRNDSILYRWNFNNPHLPHDRINNPLLYPNKSLVFAFDCVSGLRRVDSLGNIMWMQDSIHPHHSLVKLEDGNIWACTFEPIYYATGLYKLNGRSVFFIDNYITKIDGETGRILFHKSMVEILTENGLGEYILKSNNIVDPIHINDVEPAPRTTPYYDKGDVFISSRSLSLILHYRPSTNEVIEVIEGPFTSQHDVDFYGDSSIVFFNNNYYTLSSNKSMDPPKDSIRLKFAGDFYSNIIQYHFEDKSFTTIGDSVFRANRIFTETEGLVEFIEPDTYFLEEQNSGFIWIIRDDEVIYKNVLRSQHEGYHHLPNWIRILKNDG